MLLTYRIFAKKFGAAVSVISGALLATLPAFVLISRTGSPSIMALFLIILSIVLVGEIMLSNHEKTSIKFLALIFKIILGIVLALLVYCPGGIYFTLVFILIGALHPKSRLLLLRTRPWKIIMGTLFGLIILSPLIITIFTQLMHGGWGLTRTLLCLDSSLSLANIREVLLQISSFELGFNSNILTPIFSIPMLILALIGLVKLITDFFAARSYLILTLLIVSLALAFLNPAQSFWLIIPLILLVIIAVASLIDMWFTVFPKNIVARAVAVILLVIMSAELVWTNISANILALNYSRGLVYAYSQEFPALANYAKQHPNQKFQLVTSDSQVGFYQLFAESHTNLSVISSGKFSDNQQPDGQLIVLATAGNNPSPIPRQIVTNPQSRQSVLLRVY